MSRNRPDPNRPDPHLRDRRRWLAALFCPVHTRPALHRAPSLAEAVSAEIDSIGWAGRPAPAATVHPGPVAG